MKRYLCVAIFGIIMGLLILVFTSCVSIPIDYHVDLEESDRIIVPSLDRTKIVIIELISEEEFAKECLNSDTELLNVEVIEEEYIDQWDRWRNEKYDNEWNEIFND